MQVTGGCLCKAVRYRITANPIVTRVCWCRVCRSEARSRTAVVALASSTCHRLDYSRLEHRCQIYGRGSACQMVCIPVHHESVEHGSADIFRT
jgi:hypothetical protein